MCDKKYIDDIMCDERYIGSVEQYYYNARISVGWSSTLSDAYARFGYMIDSMVEHEKMPKLGDLRAIVSELNVVLINTEEEMMNV